MTQRRQRSRGERLHHLHVGLVRQRVLQHDAIRRHTSEEHRDLGPRLTLLCLRPHRCGPRGKHPRGLVHVGSGSLPFTRRADDQHRVRWSGALLCHLSFPGVVRSARRRLLRQRLERERPMRRGPIRS